MTGVVLTAVCLKSTAFTWKPVHNGLHYSHDSDIYDYFPKKNYENKTDSQLRFQGTKHLHGTFGVGGGVDC